MSQNSLRSIYIKFGVHYGLSRAWILGNFWLIYLTRNGFSLQDAALMDILFWTVMLVSEVPTGYIADWFGRKISLIISYGLQSFSIFLFAIADTIGLFLLSYGLWGFSITFASGAEDAWIYDEVMAITNDEEAYQRFFGKLITIGFLAMATSGYISGPLAEIKIEYTIYATVFLFLLDTAWIFTIPETTHSRHHSDRPSLAVAFKSLIGKRIALLIFISWFLQGLMLSVIFWYQVFLDVRSVSFTNIALVLSTGSVLMSLGSWNSSRITGGKGRWKMLPILMLMIFSILLMQLSLGGAIVAYLLLHLGRGIWAPFFSKLTNQELPSKVRATALSLIGAGMTITVVSYEYFSAWFIETNSYNAFFMLTAILITIIILPLGISYVIIAHRNPPPKLPLVQNQTQSNIV